MNMKENMEEINPNAAVDFLLKNAGLFAKAKSERVYLEEFRKSKKALLMQEAFFCRGRHDGWSRTRCVCPAGIS